MYFYDFIIQIYANPLVPKMAHAASAEDEKTLLSFGDPVDDPSFASLMRDRLYEQLRSTSAPHVFPGGQPVSFESRHLKILESEDYYVCEKSDGVRYLLYFCHPPSGPAAFLIDRNYVFRHLGPLELPGKDLNTPHDETLLDGELLIDTFEIDEKDDFEDNSEKKEGNVEDKEGEEEDIYDLGIKATPAKRRKLVKKLISYMIFDCLLVNGHNVMHQTLPNRLKHVQNDILTPFTTLKLKSDFPFDLQMKTMFKPYHMHHIFRNVIPKLHHQNDGLIFTPVKDAYLSGTCPRMLKWKPAHLNSVDFMLTKRDGKLLLQAARSGQHFDYACFRPEKEDEERWREEPPLGKILECRYDPEWEVPVLDSEEIKKGGWRFLRFREDKVMANAQHVVQKIIDSIGDNVKEEQLSKACDRLRDAWLQRHPEEARGKYNGK